MATPWELIGKYIARECSAEEKSEVEIWLQQSAENKNLLESLKRFHKKPDNIKDLDFEKFKAQDWQSISDKISHKSVSLNPWNMIWRVAASITILLISVWAIYSLVIDNRTLLVVETTDKVQEVWLSDSTYIYLNKNSRLEVQNGYAEKERKVKLKGEAYFKVKPNKESPFSIESYDITTTVLGTSFNVEAYQNSIITVSVEEGKVKVKSKDDEKILTAEMNVIYNRHLLETSNMSNANYMAWKTGLIRFENAPLDEVVEFLSDHYSKKITLSSEKAKQEAITVELNKLSVEQALEIITFTLDLNYQEEPNGFSIH